MSAGHRLIGVLLFCLAVGLYLPALGHGFVIDDFTYVSANPAVLRGAPIAAYFTDRRTTATDEALRTQVYRPLRTLAFRAVAATAGVRPVAYRTLNVLLYGLAALWLYRLCLRLTRDRFCAGWAAALWAAAPVHVEAVVYVSALGDQLSLLLSLLAMTAGLGGIEAPAPRRAAVLLSVSVALGAASLLCKEMAITTVALLTILIAAVLGPRAVLRRRSVLLLGAHAACAAVFLLLRTAVLGRVGQASLTTASLRYGLMSAPVSVWRYAGLCLQPLGHSPTYGVPPPSWSACLLSSAGLLAVFFLAARSRRPALLTGVAWFVVALLPVLNLVPVLTTMADRFALVPSLGLALAGAAGLTAVPQRLRGPGAALASTLLLILSAGTLVESRPWRSDHVLWRHAVEEEPASAQAHASLGVVLLQEGRTVEALREMDRALELGWDEPLLDLRRGVALLWLGRLPEASAAVEASLRRDPGLGRAHALLGQVRLQQGRIPEAEAELARARALAPEHVWVSLLAGELARRQGHRDPLP